MFERFRRNNSKAESDKPDEQEAKFAADAVEIEKIDTAVFTVETVPGASLKEIIALAGVTNIDPRITEENFPSRERPSSSKMQVIGSIRDSFIEDTLDDLKKDERHPATIHDLLEFMPQCPEVVWRLYALGSLLGEGGEKFCVKIEKKEGNVSLSLEQLGNEAYRDGITHYYTPWPASLLAVKNTPKK